MPTRTLRNRNTAADIVEAVADGDDDDEEDKSEEGESEHEDEDGEGGGVKEDNGKNGDRCAAQVYYEDQGSQGHIWF
jgi:hypothetical protein